MAVIKDQTCKLKRSSFPVYVLLWPRMSALRTAWLVWSHQKQEMSSHNLHPSLRACQRCTMVLSLGFIMRMRKHQDVGEESICCITGIYFDVRSDSAVQCFVDRGAREREIPSLALISSRSSVRPSVSGLITFSGLEMGKKAWESFLKV